MSRVGVVEKLKAALGRMGIKAPWAVSAGADARRVASCAAGGGSGGGRRRSRAAAALADVTALPRSSLSMQYTGPVSGPEYLSHLPRASEYRRVAPA